MKLTARKTEWGVEYHTPLTVEEKTFSSIEEADEWARKIVSSPTSRVHNAFVFLRMETTVTSHHRVDETTEES